MAHISSVRLSWLTIKTFKEFFLNFFFLNSSLPRVKIILEQPEGQVLSQDRSTCVKRRHRLWKRKTVVESVGLMLKKSHPGCGCECGNDWALQLNSGLSILPHLTHLMQVHSSTTPWNWSRKNINLYKSLWSCSLPWAEFDTEGKHRCDLDQLSIVMSLSFTCSSHEVHFIG